ncbi:MAG: hypothetical protein WBM90_01285 [Acidimicrobiia bacterium]
MGNGRVGAYGFTFENLSDAEDWLQPTPPSWPRAAVSQTVGPPAVFESRIGNESADIVLMGGFSLSVRREDNDICFTGPSRLSTAALIHPYLAPAASVLARWNGWAAFHAGVFEVDGQAWLVTADRNGGKSTTLALLSELELPVLADDLAVVRGGCALAGPRSVDLREKGGFSHAEDLGVVGERRRWRLRLPPTELEMRVVGVIKLTWSDVPTVRSVSIEDRPDVLRPMLSISVEPSAMLQVLGLPTFVVGRPRGDLQASVDLIRKVTDQ